MTWPAFLAELGKSAAVTLVGPLHDKKFSAVEPTVFIDGGSQFRGNGEKFPTISVGDGDSGGAALDVKLPEEKDFSDLAFVLRELPRHVVTLRLFGFLGGRLDHELANLGEIHQFLLDRPKGARVELEKAGHLEVIAFTGSMKREINSLFSVMVLETSEVTIAGDCDYDLDNEEPLVPGSSQGLSNLGTGQVEITSAGPCFIFLINEKSI